MRWEREELLQLRRRAAADQEKHRTAIAALEERHRIGADLLNLLIFECHSRRGLCTSMLCAQAPCQMLGT